VIHMTSKINIPALYLSRFAEYRYRFSQCRLDWPLVFQTRERRLICHSKMKTGDGIQYSGKRISCKVLEVVS
jgi:hypothetical protein